MKALKTLGAVLLCLLLFGVLDIWAYQVPEEVNIGLNAAALAQSVTLASAGGVYTDAAFAAPETEEDAVPETYHYIAPNVSVTRSALGTLCCNGEDTGELELTFYQFSGTLTCQGKEYRGAMRLISKGGGILLVNRLPMDEYLYGVVGREMSEGFPLEALKAQAVAARSYATLFSGRHASDGFDLCNGEHCQAYGAAAAESETVCRAVDETTNQVLLYHGEVAQCFYASSNGGYSEDSENVWVASLGYLRGKADPYEEAEKIPGYAWTVTFTGEEVEALLSRRGIDIGTVTDVAVTKYSANHRALELTITGTKGTKVYEKDAIRSALPKTLKSTLFTLEKGREQVSLSVLTADGIKAFVSEPVIVLTGSGLESIKGGATGEYTIRGTGFGHGVGMSQYGALFMAEQGKTYEDILKFYFTDTEIGEE